MKEEAKKIVGDLKTLRHAQQEGRKKTEEKLRAIEEKLEEKVGVDKTR